ncbi:MAG: flavodoxin family protein [Clostridia bacterium]|nr:flavodoxin family protein [Clostridia bacterium]
MNIAVINGTKIKGITYHMKEMFLEHLRKDNQITEFYPNDIPPFCEGCKSCFLRGEEKCPHIVSKAPIWQAILNADLVVFAYPVYALRAPASIKSLLDHICVHWMVHRPDPRIFIKTAVIITNSVGAPNGSAQKDVKTSLTWMGMSNIFTCGAGMMGDIFWNDISDKHVKMLDTKTRKLARKVADIKPRQHKSLKVALLFFICKLMHKGVLKTEETPSLDNQHYIDNGWISAKK